MENPFKVGEQAPQELEEMFVCFEWKKLPGYLDGNDYLEYGIRGNEIPDQKTANRLLYCLKKFRRENRNRPK